MMMPKAARQFLTAEETEIGESLLTRGYVIWPGKDSAVATRIRDRLAQLAAPISSWRGRPIPASC